MVTLSPMIGHQDVMEKFLRIAADSDDMRLGVKVDSGTESVCIFMKPSSLLDIMSQNHPDTKFVILQAD